MKADTVLAYRQSKPLRPYQAEAVDAMVSELLRGKRMLLVCPTGGGKSRMSLEVVERVREVKVGHGLVITHTTTLREQSKATIPGCDVTTIQAITKPGAAGDARRATLKSYSAVFIDEAHHLVSKLWMTALPLLAHAAVFGATATPERADGTPLGDAFEGLIPAAKYSELVEQGFLVPCDIAKPKLSRAQQKKQKVLVDGVQSYLDHGRREGTESDWRPGIYFGPTISDCESACERFNGQGIRAAVVSSEVTGSARQDIFDAYSAGMLDMLCSPVALAEGFDSPRAEVCVLCRSASSLATYIQMVGRVLRPSPGKTRALLIDCTDAASIHGSPTANRKYSLSGAGIETELGIEDQEKAEREFVEREAWRKVAIEYDIVRDRLKQRFNELQQQATDNSYNIGWATAQLRRELAFKDEKGYTIDPLTIPRVIDAKKASVCSHCRHRVKPGDPILWSAPRNVFHRDCYFETLTHEQLIAFKKAQENRT